MPYPQDPNHPLNARPNYIPGQASFASPTYSGYGGTPQGYQPAQASPVDYMRSPQTFGVDPKVKALSGAAFGQGQAMAKMRDPVNMDAGRMSASLAKTTAPMTPSEHRDILANYGGRSYMATGGLLASAPKGPAAQGPPGLMSGPRPTMSGPSAVMSGPPAPQTAAAIGEPPANQSLDLRARQPQNAIAPARSQAINTSPFGQTPQMMTAQQTAPPPAAFAQQTIDRHPGFIGSADMMKWFPQIQQEDALRNRMLAAQAGMMEKRAGEHPLTEAIQQGVAGGQIGIDSALEQLALLGVMPKTSFPGEAPPVPPAPASTLPAAKPGNEAEQFFRVANPALGKAFTAQGANGPQPASIEQIYSSLSSANPQGFNDPSSPLWANARAYARQMLGESEYERQLGNVPAHPGELWGFGRMMQGYNPFTSTQADVDRDVEKKMAPLRYFSGNMKMQPMRNREIPMIPGLAMFNRFQ